MTVTTYPTVGQDTTQIQYATLFSQLQDTGVVPTDGNDLSVSIDLAYDPNGLAVSPGRAFIRGFVYDSDAKANYTFTPLPVGTSQRLDLVVLRFDPAQDGIALQVLTGTSGQVAPNPVQDPSGIWDLPLAQLTVTPGFVTVTDKRRFTSSRVGWWADNARRPASPRDGQMGYNAATKVYESYSTAGAKWTTLLAADTGWVNVPLKTAFSGTAQVRRIGSVVYAHFAVSRKAGAFDDTLTSFATLPAGFEPLNFVRQIAPGYPSSTANTLSVDVSAGDRDMRVGRVGPTSGTLYLNGAVWTVD